MDRQVDVLVAGGGPAGMMAGLLFARAGLRTLVLEKHGDFLRDFRGDTVHPSTLRIFEELGLRKRLLELPHVKFRTVRPIVRGRRLEIGDLFDGIDPRWNFIALMPQWDFLDFVADAARAYPGFALAMNAEAHTLVEDSGRVSGLVCAIDGRERRIGSRLVVAADGRGSNLREQAGLRVRSLGAPMDVFWFRVPKQRGADNETTGVLDAGRILALLDRGDYWQCAYLFAKGQAVKVRAAGLDAFRDEVTRIAPMLADGIGAVADWDEVKLLTVRLDRLDRWHRPGLLVIGDAAHAMSPVGGVGINVAIQDAVAAANVLAGPMARGEDPDRLLARVERRRRWPVRLTQAFQATAQKRVIGPVLAGASAPMVPSWLTALFGRFAWLRRLPARFLAFGVRAEHVRSPEALR
ncbi:MAG: FAD-dependent oxidoreductase [Sphingosinicella sp.]